jgi:acyl-coenzyme A synthetase/AMP-(fatty) acid ligase
MKQEGVRAGDVVTMYLPTTPDLAACMLACARIGAIHRYKLYTVYTYAFYTTQYTQYQIRIDLLRVMLHFTYRVHVLR